VLGSVINVLKEQIDISEISTEEEEKGIRVTKIKIEEGKELTGIAVFVMACDYGCIGGGGQPYPNNSAKREERAKILRDTVGMDVLISPVENYHMRELYNKYLVKPLSEESHKVLHTSFKHRKRVSGEDIDILNGQKIWK